MGWVLMGFPLDQALADEMRRLLSVQVALVVQEVRWTSDCAREHAASHPA